MEIFSACLRPNKAGAILVNVLLQHLLTCLKQWRNNAPGAPAMPGGAVPEGRQIVIKMWDNFARLTALLAKVRVWFNNLTIYLDFWPFFHKLPLINNKPLILKPGAPLGGDFLPPRGAILTRPSTLRHWFKSLILCKVYQLDLCIKLFQITNILSYVTCSLYLIAGMTRNSRQFV